MAPMLCMVCKKNEAKVHLTQVLEGTLKKVDLCEECAKAKGVDDPMGFSLADLLMGLGASQELGHGAGAKEAACPACGFTQADFKKTGRLGCPECYQHFSDGLEALLKGMHKGPRHTGKTPHEPRHGAPAGQRIQALQKELDAAIAVENYEEAARLRDEIKSLRAGVAKPDPATP